PVINLNWQGEILFSNPACQQLLTSMGADNGNIGKILPSDFFSNLKKWQRQHQSQLNFDALIGDRHIHYSLSLLPDLGSCHLYMEDVSERIEAQAQLKYQAQHDVHTGLPNRRQFEDIIKLKIADNEAFSVLFIDIDRFKLITASQGYHIGDLTIKYMGQRLQQLCDLRQEQLQTFRLEASTFCVIINGREHTISLEVAQAIQDAMDDPLCVQDHRYYLNLSMGICHYPQDGEDARSLITHGNAALNHAQRQGDSCEVYDAQLHSAEQHWLPIESGMRTALDKQQFALHYQAKVDAQTTHIKGAEALIRWQGDDGRLISPGVFIPVAEQTGLIIKIGQWVIEEGFRQAKRFSEQKQDIQLAINISPRQFQHRHFLQQLKIALEQTQADPSKIELEITESLIMENADHSIAIMKKLKDMGFALAIDDFGTGYSSLSYLKQFPIDTLKVDQAFVKHLEHDEDDKGIVSAIVNLAQHLHLKTIAEGVETPGQWHFLQELGCDYIQGYLFSKPDVVARLLSKSVKT
ncbi:MAG: bifunctional diguanylate cyclase/phosphodiesterase, partial [Bermanella sp.]